MAKAKTKQPPGRTAGAAKRGRGKLAPGARARGLDAADVAIAMDSPEIADVVALVRNAGGALIGAYREPLGGRPLLLASLPLSAVQPTPFQRDLSPTHAKRLAAKIEPLAGLKVHPHALRHATGYALVNKGVDTRTLQGFMGHAQITNTVRYTALDANRYKGIWRR